MGQFTMSLSRIVLKFSIRGKGKVEAEFFRHLAPNTVGSIIRSLPIEGRVNNFDGKFVYILSQLKVAIEKAKNRFKKGEVAFLASGGAICVFLEDVSVAKPMNPIGNIVSGLEFFEQTSSGDVVSLIT